MRKIIAQTSLLMLALCSTAIAQSSGSAAKVLCYSAASKSFSVQSRCPKGQDLVTPALLAQLTGAGTSTGGTTATSSAFGPKTCTAVRASNQGTNFNGEVGVAASCSKGVMLSRSFDTQDNNQANPTLSSENVIRDKKGVPVGTQLVMKGRENAFYKVELVLDCCE